MKSKNNQMIDNLIKSFGPNGAFSKKPTQSAKPLQQPANVSDKTMTASGAMKSTKTPSKTSVADSMLQDKVAMSKKAPKPKK